MTAAELPDLPMCEVRGQSERQGIYTCSRPEIARDRVTILVAGIACLQCQHVGREPGSLAMPSQAVPPTSPPKPKCVHLFGILEYCTGCGPVEDRHVRECEIHERCTLGDWPGRRFALPTACCATCTPEMGYEPDV